MTEIDSDLSVTRISRIIFTSTGTAYSVDTGAILSPYPQPVRLNPRPSWISSWGTCNVVGIGIV